MGTAASCQRKAHRNPTSVTNSRSYVYCESRLSTPAAPAKICTAAPAAVSVKPLVRPSDADSFDCTDRDVDSVGEEFSSTPPQKAEVAPVLDKDPVNFRGAMKDALEQLRLRQREAVPGFTKEEVEDMVVLTREMEGIRAVMQRSNYTVEGTWCIIEKEGMLERFGQQLYDELLTRSPRLRVFFYGVDLDEQARTLVRMFGTAVHFYEKPEATADMFNRAGARHRGYGVTDAILAEMEVAFFKVFPRFVGQDVYEASKDGWRVFWRDILDLLDKGSRSPEGEKFAKIYEQQQLKKLQTDFKLLTQRQSKCELRQQFVGIMYAKAIEMHGDLSKFDALRDLRSSRRVFQAFVDITSNVRDSARIDEYLRDLGTRHIAYNVTIENMHSFTEPFLFACRHFLQEEWNVTMEARFLWFFERVVDGIGVGMTTGIENVENKLAPRDSGTFCLLFTDIEGSTKLWQTQPEAMGIAVMEHHKLVRRLIAEYGAYEVKTVGDSFIIAAENVYVGVKIALSIQLELMRMAPIAPDFTMVEPTEGCGKHTAWDDRTLRVRIGIEHCSDAQATYDTVHRRYDFYGPGVNRCARIEAATCGGQIMMSRQTFEALKAFPDFHDEPCPRVLRSVDIPSPSAKLDNKGLDHFVAVSDMGLANLKGIGHPVHLVSMVPRCLAGREFIEKVSKAPPSSTSSR